MLNDDFFQSLFHDFWAELDRSNLVEDANSMFGDEQVFEWIVRTVKPRDIVEVGSWKGHSANFMINQCKALGLRTRIVCVDTFLGGPEHWLMPGALETLHRRNGQPTILSRFLANTIACGNEGRVFPLAVDSNAAASIFSHFGFKADLIFIDAAHGYDDVMRDINNYTPLLSERGVIFGDDYQYEPLAKAVHDYSRKAGLEVFVSTRKWFLLNETLLRALVDLPDVQLRKSRDGWVHP